MTTRLLFIFLLFTSCLFAQTAPNQNLYCKERGHIEGYPKGKLEPDHYLRVYDYEDSTVICHYETKPYFYTCQRCHEKIRTEPVEVSREIVWRRNQKQLDSLWIEKAKADVIEMRRKRAL